MRAVAPDLVRLTRVTHSKDDAVARGLDGVVSMSNVAALLVPLLLVSAAACASKVEATASSSASATPSAAASVAPRATASASAASAPGAAATPLGPDPSPELSEAESARLETECAGVAVLTGLGPELPKDANTDAREAAFATVLTAAERIVAAKVPEAKRGPCMALWERELRNSLFTADARTELSRMTMAFVGAAEKRYEGAPSDGWGKALCPSAGPTPADLEALARGPHLSTDADWTAPGWTCGGINLAGQRLHWQYEVRTDVAAKKVEFIARGRVKPGTRPIELVLTLQVTPEDRLAQSTMIERR